jgi:hypothetical protein
MRTQTIYVARGVLLRRSVLSSGVLLRRRDSGVGFSVSVVTSLIKSEILRQCARPQSSHLARCVCVGHLPFGSAHSPWHLSRKDYANGLDVRLNAMVVENPVLLTSVSLTVATLL